MCSSDLNLAGVSVGEGRWNTARKRTLLASRQGPTQQITQWLKRHAHKPRLIIQASAVGFYGNGSRQQWQARCNESGIVCTIALGSSDGLRRGMVVSNTSHPITVPVGKATLGRIMDVLGNPIDERGPIEQTMTASIHRKAPAYDELSPGS